MSQRLSWNEGGPGDRPHQSRCGTTIIELILALTVVGIFVTISFWPLMRVPEQAYVTAMQNDLRNVALFQEQYLLDSGRYAPLADVWPANVPFSGPVLPDSAIDGGDYWYLRLTYPKTDIRCEGSAAVRAEFRMVCGRNLVHPAPMPDFYLTGATSATMGRVAAGRMSVGSGLVTVPAVVSSSRPFFETDALRFDASRSRPGPNGFIVRYTWTIGPADGASPTVTRTYAIGSDIPVTLTLLDRWGGQSSVTKTLSLIPNAAPELALVLTPDSVSVGDVVLADGRASSDPDGTVVAWQWTFGDGSTASGPTASHVYTAAGTYRVTLTVADDYGTLTTTEHTVLVVPTNSPPIDDGEPSNTPPTARFTTTPEAPVEQSPVLFDASTSEDFDGVVDTWTWEFGDGASESGMTVSHTYANPGTYRVVLTVTDDRGASNAVAQTLTVDALPSPLADFAVPVNPVLAYDPVTLTASASSPNGAIVDYAWEFDDGRTATGVQPVHAWADSGAYTVRLTVTDAKGKTATATHVLAVLKQWITDPAPFICDDWQLDNAQCVGPNQIQFFANNSLAWRGIPGAPASDNTGFATYTHPMSQSLKTYWVDKTVGDHTVRFQVTASSDAPPGAKLDVMLDWRPSCASCQTADFVVRLAAYDTQAHKLPFTLTIAAAYLYLVD